VSRGRAALPATVRLGYQVGGGAPVDLPIGHLCVTGQTQQAGKTTALEGLITRSGRRAVTFITKRGESSFAGGRRIAPFFRERADWQFVASLIDATLGEKNKLLRSFLMRVCRGTKTLAEVQRNVVAAKASAKGFLESIYTEIEGYLELVVPQLAQLPPATRVEIGDGLNVMDLAPYRPELQGLVIRSVIEHVYEHERGVITVIPEAWEFLPEQRGSPVRLAFETLVRKGAALENYVWIDSQDLAGVWKLAIRACPVFLVGVQREANEIKRTLANIPGGVAKPRADDVATLELGQFFACWSRHVVKTYAQPVWMEAGLAREVATGKLDARNASAIASGANVMRAALSFFGDSKEEQVTKTEAEDLRRKLAALEDENRRWRETHEGITRENDELRRRVAALEKGRGDDGRSKAAAGDRGAHAGAGERGDDGGGDRGSRPARAARSGVLPGDGHPDFSAESENLYQAIKARLIAEAPAVLQLLEVAPELEVAVERKTIKAEGSTTLGRVARLLKNGELNDARAFRDIVKALERSGSRINNRTLSIALAELVAGGFLTKEGVQRYRAVPEMQVRVVER
jgi:hypothetical protein